MSKEKIAIFGFKDSLVGQFLSYFSIFQNYDVKFFISYNNLDKAHSSNNGFKRPNLKTEFVHDNKIFGVSVLEGKDFLQHLLSKDIKKVVVLEDDKKIRRKLFSELSAVDIKILSFVHETVFLGGFNEIGMGSVIFPHCYLGYKADIKDGCILQNNCIVEHHSVVDQFCNLDPRVTVAGYTHIGAACQIHMAATIINKIKIGENCTIGAGALVLGDCIGDSLYYGQPACLIR